MDDNRPLGRGLCPADQLPQQLGFPTGLGGHGLLNQCQQGVGWFRGPGVEAAAGGTLRHEPQTHRQHLWCRDRCRPESGHGLDLLALALSGQEQQVAAEPHAELLHQLVAEGGFQRAAEDRCSSVTLASSQGTMGRGKAFQRIAALDKHADGLGVL